MTTASRSLATALWGSALRERLAPFELHHQLGHDPGGRAEAARGASEPVWTAPLVKGFLEALRTSRVRSCLRPVDAEDDRSAGPDEIRFGSLPRQISALLFGAGSDSGFRTCPSAHITPWSPSTLFSPCDETDLTKLTLKRRPAGRRRRRPSEGPQTQCAPTYWRARPLSA